jgi:hypothetical protein
MKNCLKKIELNINNEIGSISSLNNDVLSFFSHCPNQMRHYHYSQSENQLIINRFERNKNEIYDRDDWNDPGWEDNWGIFLFSCLRLKSEKKRSL